MIGWPWSRVRRVVVVVGIVLLGLAPMASGAQPDDPGDSSTGSGADIVHGEDVVVRGSICVSVDSSCLDGEEFNSAAIKAKSAYPVIWLASNVGPDWKLFRGLGGDFEIRNDLFQPLVRVKQDAPSELLTLTADGVGINIADPQRSLHVQGSAASTAVVTATNTTASDALRTVFSISNLGPPSFTLIDRSPGGADWFFRGSQQGPFAISTNSTSVTEMQIAPGGNVTIAGSLTQASSRDVKRDIAPVDTSAILEAVLGLDLTTWSYAAAPDITHLGPMSEDFHAAFGLGHTPIGIDAVDADGVALAAIQALAAENADLQAQIDDLKAQHGG